MPKGVAIVGTMCLVAGWRAPCLKFIGVPGFVESTINALYHCCSQCVVICQYIVSYLIMKVYGGGWVFCLLKIGVLSWELAPSQLHYILFCLTRVGRGRSAPTPCNITQKRCVREVR